MAVMVALTFAASAVNYASSVVFGRMLTPASFGDLTAMLAIVVVVAIPTAAAQTVVAERLAEFRMSLCTPVCLGSCTASRFP